MTENRQQEMGCALSPLFSSRVKINSKTMIHSKHLHLSNVWKSQFKVGKQQFERGWVSTNTDETPRIIYWRMYSWYALSCNVLVLVFVQNQVRSAFQRSVNTWVQIDMNFGEDNTVPWFQNFAMWVSLILSWFPFLSSFIYILYFVDATSSYFYNRKKPHMELI